VQRRRWAATVEGETVSRAARPRRVKSATTPLGRNRRGRGSRTPACPRRAKRAQTSLSRHRRGRGSRSRCTPTPSKEGTDAAGPLLKAAQVALAAAATVVFCTMLCNYIGYMAWVSNIELGAEILRHCQWARDQFA
jgi:hypothetical protein